MDMSVVNREVIYIAGSISAIYWIHSEDSGLDYFGICCSVAFAFVTHPLHNSREVKEKRNFCA